MLARGGAEPGREAIERARQPVDGRRRWRLGIDAERAEERLQPGDGEAELAVQPAAGIEIERAAADRDGFALRNARLGDVDTPARPTRRHA